MFYIIDFKFVNYYDRSANPWDSQYQANDTFTLKLEASLPEVSDPKDCVYNGVQFTFQGLEDGIKYEIPRNDQDMKAQHVQSYDFQAQIHNMAVLSQVCQETLFVDVQILAPGGRWISRENMTQALVSRGIVDAAFYIEGGDQLKMSISEYAFYQYVGAELATDLMNAVIHTELRFIVVSSSTGPIERMTKYLSLTIFPERNEPVSICNAFGQLTIKPKEDTVLVANLVN
jgi:hypothetical protein